MKFDFIHNSNYPDRIEAFADTEVLRRLSASQASSVSPKAKDCQRQINEASSVWAVDGRRFLVVFSNETDSEGQQKATVWAVKTPGNYSRVKSVWTSCRDNVFEAVERFLIEYFELFVLTATFSSDVAMLNDIEFKLKEAVQFTPTDLKKKIRLLKVWSEIMPRFNEMVSELDERIRGSQDSGVKVEDPIVTPVKSKGRMKAFFPAKAATYYFDDTFTIAVRKECVEFYRKLRKGHALANVEVFDNLVRISVSCGGFADDLLGKVAAEGIDVQAHPKLTELLDNSCRYNILVDKGGDEPETRLFIEIDRNSRSWLDAIADPDINKEIRELISFCLDLYNELVKSPSPSIKALSRHFYD